MSESKPQRDGPMQLVGGSLQLEQDLGFQRRQWFAQRVGWALMWAAAAAGLAGFFGRGPLSTRTLSDPSGVIEVEFDRFQRAHARSEVHFSLSPAAVRDGRLQIWIDDAYLRGLRLESISPTPLSIQSRGDRQVYTFATESSSAVRVTLHYEHQAKGTVEGSVGVVGGPELRVSQFVYP